MDKIKKLTSMVYIDTKAKRDLLQPMKDNKEVLLVNIYLKKDGSLLFFEPIEEEEEEEVNENKEKQIIEKIDEDGNTYFDLI